MLGTGDPSRRPPKRPTDTAPTSPGAERARSRWTDGKVPGEVGIWVFILGDLLVFAMFFIVFMVERGQHLREFRAGRGQLDTPLGVVNTLLLLTGSLLVVLAVRAARDGAGRRLSGLVVGAMATGVAFLVDKAIEYTSLVQSGHTPGSGDFYTLFFVFTGIHAVHIVVGLGALAYLHRLVRRPAPDTRDRTTMEVCASFWHLVDLLWIVLFALLYLAA